MLLAVNAYNNCINSTLKHTPFEIINGHTSARPVNRINSKIHQHGFLTDQYQKQIKEFYHNLHDISKTSKENYIDKINKTRHKPLKYEQSIVYRKNNERNKKSARYKIMNPDIKTSDTDKIHIECNQVKYHKNSLKRPRKKFDKNILLQNPEEQPSTSA